jgi:murein DD-endopeptidase MepM/ murein hydrolase activator NlpD
MLNPLRFVRYFLFLALGICLCTAARADDKNVFLYRVTRGNTIYLMARLDRCSEATVTFTAKLDNMVCSVPLPRTVELTGPKSALLAVFAPIDNAAASGLIGSYAWEFGRRLAVAPHNYGYLLPYRNGPFRVIQAAHGAFSHNAGTADAEAIDWAMPVGTPVYPARPGTVIGIRSDCTLGGPDKKWMLDCNYVILKHEDGTMAEYLHLQYNGVLVRLGDRVTQEQPIALSGNTGYTTEPHLHFAVFTLDAGTASRSLPLTFLLRNGATYTPQEGGIY